MKKYLSVILLFWLLGLPVVSIAQQAVKKIPVTSTEYSDIYYLEHLPDDYSRTSKEYPVIIFLHGASEQGDATGQEIDKVLKNGPPKLIAEGDDMTFTVNGTTYSFIVISPQLQYATKDNWSASYIHDVVQHVLKTYRVDADRVYLTGLSMGGGTLWNYQGQHPNVAAALGILSSGWPYDPFLVQQAIDNRLPVWAFHSRGDRVIPVEVPQQWQDSLVALGANPKPRLTIYPQDFHNTWDQGYATDNTYHDPNLYEWFLTHKRYSPVPPNTPPVARAGADVAIQLPVDKVQLDGSASSDSDGTIDEYAWSQIAGPTDATLADQNTRTLNASNLKEGLYTFELQVMDNDGAQATDQVQVTVTAAPPPPNKPPVAKAGADVAIQLPANEVQLDGGASSDPDGTIETYAWSQAEGPTDATLDGQNAAKLTVTNLSEGDYVFQLKVTDDEGEEATDQVQVTVTAAPPAPNELPIARAGKDTTAQLPIEQLQLDGSASADPDGTIDEYAWSQVEGPTNAALSGQDTQVLTISDLEEGTYTFQLRVVDNRGAEAIDQVQVVVTAPPLPTNQPPVARAGADTTVQLPIDQLQLDASSSADPDGRIVAYAWSLTSGPATITLNGQDTSVLRVTDLSEGEYVFQLRVTDDKGAKASDQVQVTVVAAPVSPNQPPISRAGIDTTAQLPVEQLQLDGSASSDPEGSPIVYQWTQVSGPTEVTMVGQDSSVLTLSLLNEGTYVFQLQITDQEGATATDQVQVTVLAGVVTSVDDTPPSQTLAVYPNPAHDQLTISFSSNANRGGVLLLTDALGKVVRRWNLARTQRSTELLVDTKSVPAGLYLLQLQTDRLQSIKVFVEHW